MTITAEQLDELERKAKAAGVIRWYGSHDAHMDYMRDVDAEHIAANSPDVTLHLIAIARAALLVDTAIPDTLHEVQAHQMLRKALRGET